MINRSIRVAYLAVVPLAVIVAFLLQLSTDQTIAAAGSPAILTVRGDPAVSSLQVYETVVVHSAQMNVSVGKMVEEPGAAGGRELFLTDGEWLSRGYPAFARSRPTKVSAFTALGRRHPAGTYLVYGSEADAQSVARVFEGFGYDTVVDPALTATRILFVNNAHSWACFGLLLVLILLVISGEFASTKRYGVQRLCGTSLFAAFAKELGVVGRTAVRWSVPGAMVVAFGLLAFNGLAQIREVLLTVGFLAGIAVIALVAAHACAASLVFLLVRLIDAIRGKMRGVPVLPVYYAVRIPLIALVVVTAAQASVTLHGLRVADAERSSWDMAAQFQRVSFSSSLLGGDADWAAMDASVGPWMSRQLVDGHAFLLGVDRMADRSDNLVASVLVVDAGFVSRYPVIRSDGNRLVPDPDAVIVATPANSHLGREAGRSWAAGLLAANGTPSAKPPEILSVDLAMGQRFFTCGSGGVMSEKSDYSSSFLVDPVVVVVPGSALSPAALVSYATVGAVLFPDRDHLARELGADDSIAKYIQSVDSVSAAFAAQRAGSARRVTESALLLVLLLVSVAGTAMGIASAYMNVHRQRARVRFLLGWSFRRIFSRVLVVEAAAWLVLFGMFVRYSMRVAAQASTGVIANGEDVTFLRVLGSNLPVVACTTFGIALAMLGASLYAVSRRIYHDQ